MGMPPVSRLISVCPICVLLLLGCAAVEKKRAPAVDTGQARQAQEEPQTAVAPERHEWLKFRSLALRYEKSEELQKAIFMWHVVENLSLGDPEARRRIRELEDLSRSEGEKHLAKAQSLAKAGSDGAAQRELLRALVADPDNQEAQAYLWQRRMETDYALYEVKEGDSVVSVARRVYGDPAMAVVVAYFGDLSGERGLSEESLLRLPIPDREVRAKAGADTKAKARRVARSFDRASAEQHYVAGIGHYLEQELQEAAAEWEEALRLYPDHPNAKRDLQKVRSLLKKGTSK